MSVRRRKSRKKDALPSPAVQETVASPAAHSRWPEVTEQSVASPSSHERSPAWRVVERSEAAAAMPSGETSGAKPEAVQFQRSTRKLPKTGLAEHKPVGPITKKDLVVQPGVEQLTDLLVRNGDRIVHKRHLQQDHLEVLVQDSRLQLVEAYGVSRLSGTVLDEHLVPTAVGSSSSFSAEAGLAGSDVGASAEQVPNQWEELKSLPVAAAKDELFSWVKEVLQCAKDRPALMPVPRTVPRQHLPESIEVSGVGESEEMDEDPGRPLTKSPPLHEVSTGPLATLVEVTEAADGDDVDEDIEKQFGASLHSGSDAPPSGVDKPIVSISRFASPCTSGKGAGSQPGSLAGSGKFTEQLSPGSSQYGEGHLVSFLFHQRVMSSPINLVPRDVNSAFRRSSDMGEIRADVLGEALKVVGIWRPEEDWIDDIITRDFNGVGHLDREDFEAFVGTYLDRYKDEMAAKFQSADTSGSGLLSTGELSSYCRRQGISPVAGVVDDLMAEVNKRKDPLGLTMEGFLQIDAIINVRMGFTRKETKRLANVFARFDRDEDGQLSQHEIRLALAWMGFIIDDWEIEQLIKDADVDGTAGLLDETKFLRVFREQRERELRRYKQLFGDQDRDVNGAMDADELMKVFADLGYLAARPDAIAECRRRCNLQDKEELLFEDLYILLEDFRSLEGFTCAEHRDVQNIFDKFDVDNSCNIGGFELSNALRWLGHPSSVEELQDIMHEYDLDESGELDRQEFVKLVARFRDQEIKHVRELFETYDVHNSGVLTIRDLRPVLLRLGYMPSSEDLEDIAATAGGKDLPFWAFADLIEGVRDKVAKRVRDTYGFSDFDLKRLKKGFQTYDPKHTGFISNKQLATLLEELCPRARESMSAQARARELLAKVDENGDGMLDWMDYLRMMRAVEDRETEENLNKEKEAIKASNFSHDEIKEFRHVFSMFDRDSSGELSEDEFVELIKGIVPLYGERMRDLKALFSSIDDDGNRQLNFAEFVRVMRSMMDNNWHGINDKAARRSRTSS